MREIKVRGLGSRSLPPDFVEVVIHIQAFHPNYERMMADFEAKMNHLISDLERIGIKEETLKTLNFTIETKYSYRNNQQVFDGYEVRQSMRLSFPFRKDELNLVMRTLTASQASPLIELTFTIGDQRSVQRELLSEAVKDAKEKAIILAEASQVSLGEVKTIEEVFIQPMARRSLAHSYALEDVSLSIAPADVMIQQEVEVTWLIS